MDQDETAAVSRTLDKHTILYDVTPFSDAPIALGRADTEYANQTVKTSYSIDHESTSYQVTETHTISVIENVVLTYKKAGGCD